MSLVFEPDSIPEDEGLPVDLTEKKSHFQIDPKDCSLAADVDITGHLTKVGAEVFFRGEFTTTLNLACSRCLEAFQSGASAKVSACFLQKSEAKESPDELGLDPRDIEVEFYSENKLDLTQPIYDQILLTLPFIPLCKPDCQGLCPQCGINLNLDSCHCSAESDVDPRLAVLQQLKEKIK
ncbi:MAG: DUF177 domain-containing protein [Nitrospinaceae bacterium]